MSYLFQSKFFNIYSIAFASNVCDYVFENQEAITGDQILELTPISQVNLFVIQQIHSEWQTLLSGIQSPYFDFKDEEIERQKQAFANALSQHILVERQHLEPLLVKATQATLGLLCTPTEYFGNFFATTQPLNTSFFEDIKRYLRINAFVVPIIESHVQQNEHFDKNQLKSWIDEALEANPSYQENFEDWKEVFSKIEPVKYYEITETTLEEGSNFVGNPVRQSFFDRIAIFKSTPVILPQENTSEPAIESLAEVSTLAVDFKSDPNPQDAFPNTVADMPVVATTPQPAPSLQVEEPTQHEIDEHTPLVKPPIDSFIENIPLHQKFLFIFSLFAGNASSYDTFINRLESAHDKIEALIILKEEYERYNWDNQLDIVADLEGLIERKFPNQ